MQTVPCAFLRPPASDVGHNTPPPLAAAALLSRVSAAEATGGLETEASPSWEPVLRPGPGCPLDASRP